MLNCHVQKFKVRRRSSSEEDCLLPNDCLTRDSSTSLLEKLSDRHMSASSRIQLLEEILEALLRRSF